MKFVTSVWTFVVNSVRSVQVCSSRLRKAHMCCTKSLRGLPSVALETCKSDTFLFF